MVNRQATLDATFAALADPTRRAMVARLARGDTSVGELARPFDMSLPAISKHLRVLERAGLLRQRRDGRLRRCKLRPQPLQVAARWIEQYRRYWTSQLDALARFLEQTEPARGRDPSPKRKRVGFSEKTAHSHKSPRACAWGSDQNDITRESPAKEKSK